MSEPSREDVLDKLDALLKRHQSPPDADIPVLTDVVSEPEVDFDAIPLLTDEITPAAPPMQGLTEAEPLAPLPEPEAFVREAPQQPTASPVLEFDLPPGARYVAIEVATAQIPAAVTAAPLEASVPAPIPEPLPAPASEPPAPAVPLSSPAVLDLSDESVRLIADTIKGDVAKILETQLQQVLAQQFQTGLHTALDRALSSMLDQFVIHIEEVVKISIATELQKQLAEARKPDSA